MMEAHLQRLSGVERVNILTKVLTYLKENGISYQDLNDFAMYSIFSSLTESAKTTYPEFEPLMVKLFRVAIELKMRVFDGLRKGDINSAETLIENFNRNFDDLDLTGIMAEVNSFVTKNGFWDVDWFKQELELEA